MDMEKAEQIRKEREVYRDKIRGCLFGGAAGDALGYPVEFQGENEIWMNYGDKGICVYEKDKKAGKALISDDTQMSLFTANGVLVCDTKEQMEGEAPAPSVCVYDAYLDWYTTQEIPYNEKYVPEVRSTWLLEVPELYARRVPGVTCLNALQALKYHSEKGYEDIFRKRNDKKGAGGIMRVAPLALRYGDKMPIEELDKEGANIAMITHCHSLGYMSAAVFTHVLARIVYPVREMSLEEIVKEARDTAERMYAGDGHLPTLLRIIDMALRLAGNEADDQSNIRRIGAGWVAEETLGIALYCALRYRKDFSAGIVAAVNHEGDSDTTGAVAGNLLGALNGYEAMEEKWKTDLELSDLILEIADDLCYGCLMSGDGSGEDPAWRSKYILMKRYRGA